MKRLLLTLLALPVLAHAQANNCVMQDRTVTRSAIKIEERGPIRRDVVPHGNQKRCVVDFKVRIGADWHVAYGSEVWDGAAPESVSCGIAVKNAEREVVIRVGKTQTQNESILICKDEPRLSTMATTQIGTVAQVSQFRPHPELKDLFYHNGTECKWFVDTNFTGRDVRTFQGIICRLDATNWVVVDKF